MTRKKWILLILFILLIAGWFKLFYKTWNNERVTKNSDCIITLDVKKITNTLIWNFITTPSQWKSSNWFSSSKEGKVSWDDMISLPDYIFIFHRTGEPDNAFYTVVEINDKEDFTKGLKQYGFAKTADGSYLSKETGIEFIQNGDKLLIGNAAVENKEYIRQTAADLFDKKDLVYKSYLKSVIQQTGHFSMHGPLLRFSLHPAIMHVKGFFDDSSISLSLPLSVPVDFYFPMNEFRYSDSAMLSIGISRPPRNTDAVLPGYLSQKISKAVNFNIDSFLLPTNSYYQLHVPGIYPRTDSAVSFTYDDNFNPVEKVIVNKVEEPAYIFSVTGKDVTTIYDYWKRNGQLENSDDSVIFTPVPFVKSYCTVKNKNTLTVSSAGYKEPANNRIFKHGLFFRILLTKIPPSVLNYLQATLRKLLKNIETIEAFDSYEGKRTVLNIQFNKKKNDLPLVEF